MKLLMMALVMLAASCASSASSRDVGATSTPVPEVILLEPSLTPSLTASPAPTSTTPVVEVTATPVLKATDTPVPTQRSLSSVTPTLLMQVEATEPPASTPTPITLSVTPVLETEEPATPEPIVQLVTLINQERGRLGLNTLQIDPRLTTAAQAHSQDMADNNFFDHQGSDNSTPGDRLTRAGYAWIFFAENLGCYYNTPEIVLQAWLESPGHQANLLAPEPEHIGVGLAYNLQGECQFYWTSVFAAD